MKQEIQSIEMTAEELEQIISELPEIIRKLEAELSPLTRVG